MTAINETFVSVVLVPEYSEDSLLPTLKELQPLLARHYPDYEIVVVNQSSTDDLHTARREILSSLPCIRFLGLATRVDPDVAVAAGVENAIGDFVVVMSPETDPPWIIPLLVEQCCRGNDIVIGVAPGRQSLGYAIFRPIAQFLLDAIDYRLPRNATRLCCLSRKAVNAATATGRLHHQFMSRVMRSGYRYVTLPYEQLNSRLPYKGLPSAFVETIRLLVFNSTLPLRWINCLGLIGSAFTFLFALYSVVIRLFKGHVVEGWTTTILFMSFPFMLLFVILSFLGEYLVRLLNSLGEPDEYTVAYEQTSSVMVNEHRVNVFSEAVRSLMNSSSREG